MGEVLPSDVKAAARVFGFNQQKWDNEEDTPVFNTDWDDLTNEQKDAALTLGYDESLWCDDFDIYEDDIRETYLEMNWAELPQDAQSAAQVLGFDQDSWDNDSNIPSFDKDWEELSTAEQQAAMTLGWDQDKRCEEYDGYLRARQ